MPGAGGQYQRMVFPLLFGLQALKRSAFAAVARCILGFAVLPLGS